MMKQLLTLIFCGVFSFGLCFADPVRLTNVDTGEAYGPFHIEDGAEIRIDGETYKVEVLEKSLSPPEQKLHDVVLDEVRFQSAAFSDVTQFLHVTMREHHPEGVGVPFLLKNQRIADFPRVNLQAQKVSVLEILLHQMIPNRIILSVRFQTGRSDETLPPL
jgi:hypothetical protein